MPERRASASPPALPPGRPKARHKPERAARATQRAETTALPVTGERSEHTGSLPRGRAGEGGTILAFDFGTQRIGVAVGEGLLGRARALTTIAAAANDARFAAIGKLIDEWQPARLVVGLPLSLDGAAHEMTARSRRFAHQLEGRFRLPVELVDERFSSAEAERELRAAGRLPRSDKAKIDAEAARVILQSWFEHARTA